MPSPTTLLVPREGRTQTEILAVLACAQFEEGTLLRQREIVERLPHSKGAVSNNIGKLVEAGLVVKSGRSYRIDEDALLVLYRKHVDDFLPRERGNGTFDAERRSANEERTETKRRLTDLFKDNDLLVSVLAVAFIDSTESTRLRTVPDVCHHADEIVRQAAARIVTSEAFTDDAAVNPDVQTLLRLGVVLDRTRDGLTRLIDREGDLAAYMPGNPPSQMILAHLNGGDSQ